MCGAEEPLQVATQILDSDSGVVVVGGVWCHGACVLRSAGDAEGPFEVIVCFLLRGYGTGRTQACNISFRRTTP